MAQRQDSLSCWAPESALRLLVQLHPDPRLQPGNVPSSIDPVAESFDFIVLPGVRTRHDTANYHRWLCQLLPKDFPDSRILLFIYDALDTFGEAHLFNTTRHFLDLLIDKRKHDPFRPIVFLAHSVGGIFLKYALVQAREDPKYRSIKESARGIAFFGTPHHGFPQDISIEALVRNIAGRLLIPSRSLSTASAAATLTQGNGLLILKAQHFWPIKAAAAVHKRWLDEYRTQLHIVSFYETMPAVVSRFEAVLGLPAPLEYAIPLATSHTGMIKFGSHKDPNYQLVRGCLSCLVIWAGKADPERGDLGGRELLLFRFLYPEGLSSGENRIRDPLDGTCAWLLSSHSFKEWLTSAGSHVLHITGKPGSGKSTLARHVLQSVPSLAPVAPDRPMISFLRYFSDAWSPPKNAESILRLMLHQAVTTQPSLLRFVAKELKQSRNLWPGNLTRSLGSTIYHLAKHQRVIILLDGLDEFDNQVSRELVETLSRDYLQRVDSRSRCGCEDKRPTIKMLLTSRSQFRHSDLFVSPVNLVDLSSGEAAAGVKRDSCSLISRLLHLPQGPRPDQLDILDPMLMRLVSDTTERTAGIFLWVRLVISVLAERVGSLRDTKAALNSMSKMPEGLHALYQLLLDMLQRDGYQLKALQLVLFARRPLKLEELQEALSIDLTLSGQLDQSWPKSRSLPFTQNQKAFRVSDHSRIISPFLDIEGSTVQLIHQSVKDFLLARFSQRLRVTPTAYVRSTNDRLFEICAAHLTTEPDNKHSFSSYAAKSWYGHFQSRTNISLSQRRWTLDRLCSPRSRLLPRWFPIWWEEKWSQEWELARYPHYPTKGIILAFLGDELELKSLLERRIVRAEERTIKGEEWTPLMAACWSGHEAVVDLLLAWQAKDDFHPQLGARALTHAIDHGHTTIAQALTTAFATATLGPRTRLSSLNAFVNGDGNPFLAATRRGSLEMMKLLIDGGFALNIGSFSGRGSEQTPLHLAIRLGYEDIVKLLLDKGADLDSYALSLACDSDDDDMVSVVLDNVHRRGDGLWESWDAPTLLRFSTKLQDKKFVAELLGRGIDPTLNDVSGVSALDTASRNGWVDGIQLFSTSNRGASAYTLAFLSSCQDAAVDMVKLFLELGINPNSLDASDDRTAIQHVIFPKSRASRSSQLQRLEVIRVLLNYGADVNHTGIRGDTGLHLASRHREECVAALLVEAGADASAENCDGETALDLAARNGDVSLIALLLKAGCPARAATWRSALSSGNIDAVRYILPHLHHSSLQGSFRELKPQLALEPVPSEIAQHFVMCGDAPSRFEQAVGYLRVNQVLNDSRIELDFFGRLSFTDILKTWWEKTTSAKWHWWPLTPPAPCLTPDKAWIKWFCGNGTHQHRVMIPLDLAVDIQDLFLYQAKVSSLAEPFFCHSKSKPGTVAVSSPRPSCYLYVGGNVLETVPEEACHTTSATKGETVVDMGRVTLATAYNYLGLKLGAIEFLPTRKRLSASRNTGYRHIPVRAHRGAGPDGVELARCNPPATTQSVNPSATSSGFQTLQNSEQGPDGQDPAPDPDPNHNSDEEAGTTARRGRWVYLKPSQSSEPEPLDVLGWHDIKFCDELRAKYKAVRSYIRKYLSIMRFHHWGFDKFEQTGRGAIRSKSSGSKNEVYLPAVNVEDLDYEFVRFNPPGDGAPVSQVVFCGHYYGCERRCRIPRFVHRCSERPRHPVSGGHDEEVAAVTSESRILPYVPKRYELWEPPDRGFESVYGLTAFELPSFFGFWAYSCLAGATAAIFWALWLTVLGQPMDLQNASIPAIIFIALWVAWLQSFRAKGWNRFEEC